MFECVETTSSVARALAELGWMSATVKRNETSRLVVASAGTTAASSTRLLADGIVLRVRERLLEQGIGTLVEVIELSQLAGDVAQSLVSGLPRPAVERALASIGAADGLILCTPVYKAGMSGLFKSFFDLMENDRLIGVPVVLAATGGTSRHSLVVDAQMRTLFAFFRTSTVPTSIYAAPEDWSGPDLAKRIDRAAAELSLALRSSLAEFAELDLSSVQHRFARGARGTRSALVDAGTRGAGPDPSETSRTANAMHSATNGRRRGRDGQNGADRQSR